ncbi:MAG: stage II sporulation protein M [Actinomycetota bacterium]|nr:stage II sporulation protein M [Actinomycetota bacterium]
MKLERFLSERGPAWKELQGLLRTAGGKPERLGPSKFRRAATLYRSAAADLALARRLWPTEPAVRSLETIVAGGYALVYESHPRTWSPHRFLATVYWRRVVDFPPALAVAALFLLVPTLLGVLWGISSPDSALELLPPEFAEITEPKPGGDLGFTAAEKASFSTVIFTNNIQVTFLAFAAGILLGLGTVWVLLYNGMIIGVLAGVTIDAGTGGDFYELVVAHGVLEISCIIVAGSAGLRLGWALISPGVRSRGQALLEEARGALDVILGTTVWLILAGLVEGFITPERMGNVVVTVVGVGLAALYWTLVWLQGVRVTDGPVPSL